jgi:hypothetical protein
MQGVDAPRWQELRLHVRCLPDDGNFLALLFNAVKKPFGCVCHCKCQLEQRDIVPQCITLGLAIQDFKLFEDELNAHIVGFQPVRLGLFDTLKLSPMFSPSMRYIARVMFTYNIQEFLAISTCRSMSFMTAFAVKSR